MQSNMFDKMIDLD